MVSHDVAHLNFTCMLQLGWGPIAKKTAKMT